MDKSWLKQYPAGVPKEIDASRYETLVTLLDDSFKRFRDRPAFKFMGLSLRYGEVDAKSRELAGWLQAQGLLSGDRVAIMMPNVPQYAVALVAILRAGCIAVNVNPLYTPRELEHQLKDSGAKAIFIVENFAHTLSACIKGTAVRTVVVTGMGDMLPFPKREIVNFVLRKVKKLVPPYELPGSHRFNDAVAQGARAGSAGFASGSSKGSGAGNGQGSALPANGANSTGNPRLRGSTLKGDDIAVLQYTGGTTGVSKGAVLLHRNLVANTLQSAAWNQPAQDKIPAGVQPHTVGALPLYHIFAFTTILMLSMHTGGCVILIPNPRDLPSVFKDLAKQPFHSFPAVNTLFNAMAHHADFDTVNWSHLVLSVGGGMAVQSATAKLWLAKTGCPIVEGYGLSETSPSVACNPTDSTTYTGTIGLPLPSTEIALLDDDGREVEAGTPGEIAVRGPQVMAGYWQRPDETARVMTPDGYLRTGDIGTVDERGYFRIVDRKKDMIIVSGFNVYPNEVEDILTQMDGVLECAAVGVPDARTGEAVKVVIVRKRADLTEAEVRAFSEAMLTGYKRPKLIEFRNDLPKTPVGKILRRELRDAA
ncbi:MAG: long-chain fatty acid--CoA ligase [Rhizobacter sp.]|nr:long-chain fatty acid--CoA ligase [Rhizobacter sp.]